MMLSIYCDHPIHTAVKRILEIQNLPQFGAEVVVKDEEYSFARDKIFLTTSLLHDLLKNTPVELVSINSLHSINTHFQQILFELTHFLNDTNPQRLINAATYAENTFSALCAFVPTTGMYLKESLPSLLEAHRKYSSETIEQFSKKYEMLSQHLADLGSDSDTLERRLQEIVEGSSRERAESAATIAKLEQAFAEAELARQQNFDNALKSLKEAFDEKTKEHEIKASTIIDNLNKLKEQASKIVQVVGNIGVTGNYQAIADKESNLANKWRLITLGIFSIGVLVAGATFVKFWGEPFNTENAPSIIIRLIYAVVITLPAWYSARESARHRSNADKARVIELELASIGPFIELLPEDKKIEIRTALTHLYFGRTSEPHTVQAPIDLNSLKDLIVDALKAVKPQ